MQKYFRYIFSSKTRAMLALCIISLVPTFVSAQVVQTSTGLNVSATVGTTGTGTTGTTGTTGGGGGGGGFPGPTARVNFTGRAYPLSRVTILQDGAVAVRTIAGPDARFSVSVGDLSSGNYVFAVYGEDSSGRRSRSFSFPLMITVGSTVDVSGIFIAPTIDVDKTEVRQGDNVVIFGQSAPSSTVVISVHSESETFHSVSSDAAGAYLYTLDTSALEIGSHAAKSKAVVAAEASSYGEPVAFTVGTENIKKNPYCGAGKGDLNCDKKVNLIDYSIMAYWYKKSNPPVRVDLNLDARITLIDFSILAFYWTG